MPHCKAVAATVVSGRKRGCVRCGNPVRYDLKERGRYPEQLLGGHRRLRVDGDQLYSAVSQTPGPIAMDGAAKRLTAQIVLTLDAVIGGDTGSGLRPDRKKCPRQPGIVKMDRGRSPGPLRNFKHPIPDGMTKLMIGVSSRSEYLWAWAREEPAAFTFKFVKLMPVRSGPGV